MPCIVVFRMLSELLTAGGEMSKFIVADLSTIVQGFCVGVSPMKSVKARTHPPHGGSDSKSLKSDLYI